MERDDRPQGSGERGDAGRRRREEVRFVLVEPRVPGNVGAAARAIKNFGFDDLTLVSPRCDPACDEARFMAVDAVDVLDLARTAANLDDALDGIGTVVGTTRRGGKQRRPHFRLDAIAPELARLAAAGPLAFLFGREAHGLTDGELDRCTHLVHFPASEAYPSLNLAQSVLLCAYETRRALLGPPAEPALEPPAGHREREAMYSHLGEALHAIGFLKEDSAEAMMRRVRRILGRAALTPGDVAVFRGVARQILWCAARAGLAVGGDARGETRDGAEPPADARGSR